MPDNQSASECIRAAERMRIAQHLHDSAFQLLAVLQLTLGRMRRQGIEGLEANIADCEEMIAQIGRQIRQIDKTDPS
jgi:signal transduction histidine kinase